MSIQTDDTVDTFALKKGEIEKSICNYLIEGYRARAAKYTHEKSRNEGAFFSLSPEIKEFWDVSTSKFEKYISDISKRYARKVGYKKPETRGKRPSSSWDEDPIQDFKKAFIIVEDLYLINSGHHKSCKDLFEKLIAEIEASTVPEIPQEPEKASVLGRVHYRYIEKMLDISDDTICALLPFLLTAYTYNFRYNRFMNRGSEIVEGAFSDELVDTAIKARIKGNLKALATRFFFPQEGAKFPGSSSRLKYIDAESMRPTPMEYVAIEPRTYPSLKFREVLDSVFAIWCYIFCLYIGDNDSEIHKKVSEKVDIVLCTKLYLYYTDNPLYQHLNSNGFPGLKQIEDFIKDQANLATKFTPHMYTYEIISNK